MARSHIVIAGITGKIGRLIASHLIDKPDIYVTGICRDAAKLPNAISEHDRVRVMECSAEDASRIRKALKGAACCICCYLGDDSLILNGQKVLIEACIAEGVPRYIPSDFSLDFDKLEYGEHPQIDPHKRVKDFLAQKTAKGEIKAAHIFCGIMSEVLWSFNGMFNPTTRTFFYWETGDEVWETTTYSDVAQFAAEVAVDPEANGTLRICGDHVSPKQLAANFKAAYGSAPSIERLGSFEDLYAEMEETMEIHKDSVFAWMDVAYTWIMLTGRTTMVEPLSNSRYPNIKWEKMGSFMRRYEPETIGRSAVAPDRPDRSISREGSERDEDEDD